MAAILVANYQNIAGYINTAQIFVSAASDYWYDAALEIVLLDEFDPSIDLLIPFYNAYLAAVGVYASAPASGVAAVTKLQQHVINRAKQNDETAFTSINDWIAGSGGRFGDVDTAFTVGSFFAAVSLEAGYTITSGNVT